MRRSWTTVLVSAIFGLLLVAAGGEGRAGSDPPPHPDLSECQAVWDAGSARNSCSQESVSTGPGKCVIEAECEASPRYANQGYNEGSIPREGCEFDRKDTKGGDINLRFWFKCDTEVEFSPNDTDSVTNCDGQLRTGSSC